MKTVRLLAVSVFFAAIFAVSALAQTPTTGGKIGLINTEAFYASTGGISKLAAANTSLENEFKPLQRHGGRAYEYYRAGWGRYLSAQPRRGVLREGAYIAVQENID